MDIARDGNGCDVRAGTQNIYQGHLDDVWLMNSNMLQIIQTLSRIRQLFPE